MFVGNLCSIPTSITIKMEVSVNRLLVITSQPDPHVEMVTKRMGNLVETLIFDPFAFPLNESISFKFANGFSGVHVFAGDLDDVAFVWYRKPRWKPVTEFGVAPEYHLLVETAYRETVMMLYGLLPNAIWISDYWSIMRANNKALQIQLAHNLGFTVPETLITSVPSDALRFIDEHNAKVVTKPLGTGYIMSGGSEFYDYFYATSLVSVLRELLVPHLEGLRVAPAIFQRQVPNYRDIRVTIVNGEVFACEVLKKNAGNVDWRREILTNDLVYTMHDLPKDLVSKCLALLDSLHLRFGVVEFVLTPDGEYVFMEINPNGQWAFIELACPELDISSAFARLFVTSVG